MCTMCTMSSLVERSFPKIHGKSLPGLRVQVGVDMGSAMSPLLFCLAMDVLVRYLDCIPALGDLRSIVEQNESCGPGLADSWFMDENLAPTCLASHIPLEVPLIQQLVRRTTSCHQWCTLVRAYMDDNQTAVYDPPTLYLIQWLYLQFESAGLVVKKHTCANFMTYNLGQDGTGKRKGCASWMKNGAS